MSLLFGQILCFLTKGCYSTQEGASWLQMEVQRRLLWNCRSAFEEILQVYLKKKAPPPIQLNRNFAWSLWEWLFLRNQNYSIDFRRPPDQISNFDRWNHLPKTCTGSLSLIHRSLVWYGLFWRVKNVWDFELAIFVFWVAMSRNF